MRNMSFFLTTTAVKNRTKTHTLRDGWKSLKPGDRVQAVVKARGLRPKQQIEPLATIQIASVERRPLDSITQAEVIAEGFPDWTPEKFVQWFTIKMKCQPTLVLTFISFTYTD
jgi:hypothetical protein